MISLRGDGVPGATSRIVVVGGGVIGLAIVVALRKLGARSVVLLERSKLGSGSSAELTGGFRDMYAAAPLVALSQRSIDLFQEFNDAGESLGWSQCGYLYLGTEESQFARLPFNDTNRELYRGRVERLTPQEVARRFPWVQLDDVIGGAFYDYAGVFTPRLLVEALTSRCRDAGIEIREGTNVDTIEVSGGRVSGVTTESGGLAADVVIVATGGWTAAVLSSLELSLPIVPKRSQLFLVSLPASERPPTSFVHDYSIGGYLRPGYDGVVLGGYLDTVVAPNPEPQVTAADGPRAVSLLARRLPAIANAPISKAWAGNRDVTPDDHGVIDGISGIQGLYVAAGFGSHGSMHALGIGEAMSALVMSARTTFDLGPFSASRFGD